MLPRMRVMAEPCPRCAGTWSRTNNRHPSIPTTDENNRALLLICEAKVATWHHEPSSRLVNAEKIAKAL
jgi:hypothetical protein